MRFSQEAEVKKGRKLSHTVLNVTRSCGMCPFYSACYFFLNKNLQLSRFRPVVLPLLPLSRLIPHHSPHPPTLPQQEPFLQSFYCRFTGTLSYIWPHLSLNKNKRQLRLRNRTTCVIWPTGESAKPSGGGHQQRQLFQFHFIYFLHPITMTQWNKTQIATIKAYNKTNNYCSLFSVGHFHRIESEINVTLP